MIHAIPFKVVHPCPRPRAVPPCVTTTSTSLRPSPSTQLPLSRARCLSLSLCRSLFRSFPLLVVFLSSHLLARSLTRTLMPAHNSCAHAHITYARNTHTYSMHTRSLSYYPPTGSLFLRVTTQWRCHTLAPSSNQCYCFIVPLLLLLLDTRKGDPSIPRRSGTPRRVARLRFASPRLAVPRLAPFQS